MRILEEHKKKHFCRKADASVWSVLGSKWTKLKKSDIDIIKEVWHDVMVGELYFTAVTDGNNAMFDTVQRNANDNCAQRKEALQKWKYYNIKGPNDS